MSDNIFSAERELELLIKMSELEHSKIDEYRKLIENLDSQFKKYSSVIDCQ